MFEMTDRYSERFFYPQSLFFLGGVKHAILSTQVYLFFSY